jgi:4-amino-4-deoxy-L-arabinose transferase-like glycosyltransferase
LLAVYLNFAHLEQEGFANLYYAAAVKSMLTSPKNFFFASFDPAGFVSVDKPPLGLWLQAISATIFGFTGWSLILPQALAGVLSVLVLYILVRRVFGPSAGLLAALALALMPIFVAANRNNTMDSQLVFTSLLAAWTASLAAERGQLRWLLLCALLVGIGFNIKMLQAVLVLPAFFLLYLFTAPLHWARRLLHLGLAGILLIVVSLSWAIFVDLTPADQRPYIGSSQDNSVLELMTGHNGLKRLLPGRGQPTPPRNLQPPGQPGSNPDLPHPAILQTAPPTPSNPGRNMLQDETGEPGILRLWNEQLAGQVTWLLPLAVLGGLVVTRPALQSPAAFQKTSSHLRREAILLWMLWLAPQVIFFSIAGLFHRYYLAMLAPGIAALVGASISTLAADLKLWRTRAWILPAILLLTALLQAIILSPFPAYNRWLTPSIFCLVLLSCAGLILLSRRVFRLEPNQTQAEMSITSLNNAPEQPDKLRNILIAVGMVGLLLAPATWSYTPILYGGNAALPYAGPGLARQQGGPLLNAPTPTTDLLVTYLQQHRNGETHLLAMLRAMEAAPIILATGEPVMALGGFSGNDPILTSAQLQDLVQSGEVRFFFFTGEQLQPGRIAPQAELIYWVQGNCRAVPLAELGLPPLPQQTPPARQFAPGNPLQALGFYDCHPDTRSMALK